MGCYLDMLELKSELDIFIGISSVLKVSILDDVTKLFIQVDDTINGTHESGSKTRTLPFLVHRVPL